MFAVLPHECCDRCYLFISLFSPCSSSSSSSWLHGFSSWKFKRLLIEYIVFKNRIMYLTSTELHGSPLIVEIFLFVKFVEVLNSEIISYWNLRCIQFLNFPYCKVSKLFSLLISIKTIKKRVLLEKWRKCLVYKKVQNR